MHDWLQSHSDFHRTQSLSDVPKLNRIGHYFAALVEFWLRYCPKLNSQKVLARQAVGVQDCVTEVWGCLPVAGLQ